MPLFDEEFNFDEFQGFPSFDSSNFSIPNIDLGSLDIQGFDFPDISQLTNFGFDIGDIADAFNFGDLSSIIGDRGDVDLSGVFNPIDNIEDLFADTSSPLTLNEFNNLVGNVGNDFDLGVFDQYDTFDVDTAPNFGFDITPSTDAEAQEGGFYGNTPGAYYDPRTNLTTLYDESGNLRDFVTHEGGAADIGGGSYDVESQPGGFYGNTPNATYDPRTNTTTIRNDQGEVVRTVYHGGGPGAGGGGAGGGGGGGRGGPGTGISRDNALLMALLGGLLGLLGRGSASKLPVGYQGGIPKYTAKRVPGRGVEYTRAAKGGLMSLAEGGPAEMPTANAAPAISNEQIANFVSGVQARGGNDAEIAAAMDQYGVTPGQMAGALGVGTDVIQNRYNVATPIGKYSTAPNLGGVVLAGDSWLSNPEHSSRISQQLGGANVVNTAIGGSTTGDILNRLNTYLDQGGRFDPGTTVMMNIGGNDLLRGLEADQISQNINQIASLLGERGANLILSGAPQVGSVEDITSSTSLGLNPIYQEIADANRNVTLVDSMADLLNQKNLVDESGFHLNEIGRNAFDASLAQAYRRSQGMGEFALPDEVVRQYIEENRLTPSQARGIARYFDLTDADIDRILGTTRAAGGGLMGLAGGGRPARYLRGGTDGMADKIETSIDGKQPARLSHGEFVIPADVVSHLGNGNSDAGADVLYDMMAKVRKARTGTSKQGKQINPRKMIPA